jgi:hypothetical protein
LAYFVSDHSPNNVPALPVREGENLFVWFAGFDDRAAYDRYAAALGRSPRWRDELSAALSRRLKGRPHTLRLAPTARSWLRGRR